MTLESRFSGFQWKFTIECIAVVVVRRSRLHDALPFFP